MKFSAVATSLLCLAAHVAAGETTTSISTTTITKTLLRVNAVTATPSSSSMTSVPATSTRLVTSKPTSSSHPAAPTKTGAAVHLGAGVPAVLVAGSFALVLGQAL
ncbi:uncharacterized protein PFLUO_LOCUS6975 [Penicillium psychrofluorescens]|uniref:uncharacterized protein n=1 Tax=Penicillium psychrofluorescens TaxID=3158075 RepID=UPI003CCD6C9E